MSNIAERLERLPFGKFHIRLLLMGGLGYMFEAVDAAIIAFLLPVLRTKWQLTSLQTGFLASSTFYGFLVGALCAGAIGDRFGRKNVMMWALVFFCLASLAAAAVNDWQQFFVLRIIGGIGMGAEGAIIAPFLSEFVSAKRRGAGSHQERRRRSAVPRSVRAWTRSRPGGPGCIRLPEPAGRTGRQPARHPG